MDQEYTAPSKNIGNPPKLLALLALILACALPFILVKSFPHKHISVISSIPMLLPEVEKAPKPNAPKPFVQQKILPIPIQTVVQAPKPIDDNTWKTIKTRKNDSLMAILARAGIDAQTQHLVKQANLDLRTLTKLAANQEVQLLIKNQVLEKIMMPFSDTQYLVIYHDGRRYKSKINTRQRNSHNHFLTATIQGSLYNTAKKQHIPPTLIKQMIDIFTWDINFSKDVRTGDQITLIYKAYYIEDKQVGTGDILAVSYRGHNKTYQAVRHTNKQGQSDYFTPQGTSLKKAFLRFPLHFSHISSTFSLARYHPILHYRRTHKGIDLAAPIGTPIQATGDGRVELIGRQNGYGNMIKINHQQLYSTVYAHMLRFRKGLSKGDFVKRGEVIGYVGQTGLASGPHCHYEFHINHQAKNPATVELPRGTPVPAREMANFKATSTNLFAQLKLFESSKLAKITSTKTSRRKV